MQFLLNNCVASNVFHGVFNQLALFFLRFYPFVANSPLSYCMYIESSASPVCQSETHVESST